MSILLLFPARTLQFNINIVRKRKGRTVKTNLKTSVYPFITCRKLIKEILIHNTMEMETYFLKVLFLCIAKTKLCSDRKHKTMGKRQSFPSEFGLHKKSSSVHPQRLSKTQWQEGQPKYLARLLPAPTHEPCKATLYQPKRALGHAAAGRNSTQGLPSKTFSSFCFVLEKLS